MQIKSWQEGGQFVLYDANAMPKPSPDYFDPAWWRARDLYAGTAEGRAAVAFVRGGKNGETWVLRNYRRGGMVRHLLRDSYWWEGLEATRPWREFSLTASLHANGLPVPRPVAARVVRSGLFYGGDLITAFVDESVALADVLAWRELPERDWNEIGAMLRRFHAAGVRHDDINGRNILRDANARYHLIDFDKADVQMPGDWMQQNIARLRRSLDKFKATVPKFHFGEGDWTALMDGYRG